MTSSHVVPVGAAVAGADFRSSHLAVGLNPTRPAFSCFAVDSLGGGEVDFNPVLSFPADPVHVRLEKKGEGLYHYYPLYETSSAAPLWTVELSGKEIILRSEYAPLPDTPPGLWPAVGFCLTFRQKACHATLLGLMPPGEQKMNVPCVLHLPDQGSMRITGSVPDLQLDYDACRYVQAPLVRYVHIVFPAATAQQPRVEYRLETVALYPELPGIEKDPRFDAFRRNYLNMFQILPRRQMLGTNASSDICPFVLYMFAEAGANRVKLADGLDTSDLVRMTADRYLSGVKGYGQVGDEHGTGKYQFADVDPSLILGSGTYIHSTQNWDWARQRYDAVRALCEQMLATDSTGNGLIKYGTTGNFNDRPTTKQRPANWWDTINFGYEDAYSNTLAYRALVVWADVAEKLGKAEDVAWLRQAAAKLKAAYQQNFLNPKTGILAGWKSADGALHDYWFLFLNSIAIAYGVVDGPLAHDIMDRCLKKLDEVGYRNFRLGLPGNLVPVPRGDYVLHDDPNENPKTYGVPLLEDGTDGFPYYENGGASMRYVLFTLRALYRLGRVDDARRMLYPMLEGYAAGEYQGFDRNGISNDWRNWQGKACGYEGFAVGNYLPLLAVIDDWKAR